MKKMGWEGGTDIAIPGYITLKFSEMRLRLASRLDDVLKEIGMDPKDFYQFMGGKDGLETTQNWRGLIARLSDMNSSQVDDVIFQPLEYPLDPKEDTYIALRLAEMLSGLDRDLKSFKFYAEDLCSLNIDLAIELGVTHQPGEGHAVIG